MELYACHVGCKNISIRFADLDDVDVLSCLEVQTWIPPLQATRETIASRIQAGHRVLMAVHQAGAVASVCWHDASPQSPVGNILPKTFNQFSGDLPGKTASVMKGKDEPRVAYIYNVGTHAAYRGQGIATLLVQRALHEIRCDGISNVFLDGRCSSYKGSQQYAQETVLPVPAFQAAIDSALRRGTVPTCEEARLDPTLRFYIRQGFRPHALCPNFYPTDSASGAFRVMMHYNWRNL